METRTSAVNVNFVITSKNASCHVVQIEQLMYIHIFVLSDLYTSKSTVYGSNKSRTGNTFFKMAAIFKLATGFLGNDVNKAVALSMTVVLTQLDCLAHFLGGKLAIDDLLPYLGEVGLHKVETLEHKMPCPACVSSSTCNFRPQ